MMMHSTWSRRQFVQGAPCSTTLQRTLRDLQHWQALDARRLTGRCGRWSRPDAAAERFLPAAAVAADVFDAAADEVEATRAAGMAYNVGGRQLSTTATRDGDERAGYVETRDGSCGVIGAVDDDRGWQSRGRLLEKINMTIQTPGGSVTRASAEEEKSSDDAITICNPGQAKKKSMPNFEPSPQWHRRHHRAPLSLSTTKESGDTSPPPPARPSRRSTISDRPIDGHASCRPDLFLLLIIFYIPGERREYKGYHCISRTDQEEKHTPGTHDSRQSQRHTSFLGQGTCVRAEVAAAAAAGPVAAAAEATRQRISFSRLRRTRTQQLPPSSLRRGREAARTGRNAEPPPAPRPSCPSAIVHLLMQLAPRDVFSWIPPDIHGQVD